MNADLEPSSRFGTEQEAEDTMVISASKRTQHCTFCKNHGSNTPKKGHQCPFSNCPCLLCTLTKKAQVAMRHQQRVWRHQKQKLKSQKLGIEKIYPGVESRSSKSQVCDKCRNHNILIFKRSHPCPYSECKCEYCSLTFKRREFMKHQQMVRRSKITAQVESDGASEFSCGEKQDQEDSKEYVYYRNEENHNIPSANSNEKPEEVMRCVPPAQNQIINGSTEREVSIIPMENLSLRPGMAEADVPHRQQSFSNHSENSVSPQGRVDQLVSESPPPLIRVVQSRSSSPQICLPVENHHVPHQNSFEHPLEDKISPVHFETNSSSSPHYEQTQEEPEEDVAQVSSFMCFNRESTGQPSSSSLSSLSPSSSFRSLPFQPSQPLQSLSALNASLEPSMNTMKFETPMEAFHFSNSRRWLPSSLIGSPLGDIPQSAALFLRHHHQQQQELHASQHRPLVRPLPVNIRPLHHSAGPFPPAFWSHMFLPSFKPFNLGLHPHSSSDPCLDRYSGLENHSRFPSTELFHST